MKDSQILKNKCMLDKFNHNDLNLKIIIQRVVKKLDFNSSKSKLNLQFPT